VESEFDKLCEAVTEELESKFLVMLRAMLTSVAALRGQKFTEN